MIEKAQKFLKEMKIDGWLLYDFHGNNPLTRRVLAIPSDQMTSRRYFYWIPAHGEPVKIVHAIESHVLDQHPGSKKIFFSWQSLESELKTALKGAKKVAMEYSPKNAIPYVSCVDGGTVDLVRSFGCEVVSSADFLLHFTSVLDREQIESQRRAGAHVDRIVGDAWKWIADHLKQGKTINEYDVQQKIMADFKKGHLFTDHAPIVGVNANSADPHYSPEKEGSSPIRKGDFILIDLFAKEAGERNIWGDITRVAVASPHATEKQKEIFHIVRKSQVAAAHLVKERFAHKKRIEGWEVDEAARNVIRQAGYEKFFLHRTGHSIEMDLHGSGTHMDNLEMHDVRPLLPGTCFSIEPGIYLAGEFGVRLEFDVLIHLDGTVEITGGEQDSILSLL